MFRIGDKVAHPMYGGGRVDSIVQRAIDGKEQDFYTLKLANRSMVVMVPTANSDEIGVRPVVDREEAERVLAAIPAITVEMTANWNHRYRENMERIKSGDLYEVAAVIKGLDARDRSRGLSTGERKMLHTARQILVSELVLSMDRTDEEIEARLDEALV